MGFPPGDFKSELANFEVPKNLEFTRDFQISRTHVTFKVASEPSLWNNFGTPLGTLRVPGLVSIHPISVGVLVGLGRDRGSQAIVDARL